MLRVAAIAIGSNLGDRAGNLARAAAELRRLPRSRFVALSSAIRTAAVPVAPGIDPGGPYLNAAAVIDTELEPRELLAALHDIERHMGRQRQAGAQSGPAQAHGCPRIIDLDLLVVGELALAEPDITLPHPRMLQRLFVLEPLAEIAPGLLIPGAGLTAAGALAALRGAGGGSQAVTRSAALAALLAIAAIAAATPAPAWQPAAPGSGRQATPRLVPVIPATVLREAAALYRSASIHERVTIVVRAAWRGAPGTTPRVLRREEALLRLQPPSFEPDQSLPQAMQLDLGPVRLWAEDGMLVVTHRQFAGTFYRHDYTPPLSPAAWEWLPPVPLPQLALMGYEGQPDEVPPGAAGMPAPFSPVPSVRVQRWTAQPIDPLRDAPEYTLEGQTDAGTVTLIIDAATSRVRSMTLPLPPTAAVGFGGAGVGPLELVVEVAPIAPAPIRAPDLTQRRLVASLPELAAAATPTP